jgi:hypothetical protein
VLSGCKPSIAANQDEFASCSWLSQVFFDSHSIVLRQAPDYGGNTAALSRSRKGERTFNGSGPSHQ